METIKMKLNSPITDEQWNIITDAELEHSDEIEFTTPSGKKVMYAKVRHGKWIWDDEGYHCSECWYHAQGNTLECIDGTFGFCPVCGARMNEVKNGSFN